jgi:hypothetical protein
MTSEDHRCRTRLTHACFAELQYRVQIAQKTVTLVTAKKMIADDVPHAQIHEHAITFTTCPSRRPEIERHSMTAFITKLRQRLKIAASHRTFLLDIAHLLRIWDPWHERNFTAAAGHNAVTSITEPRCRQIASACCRAVFRAYRFRLRYFPQCNAALIGICSPQVASGRCVKQKFCHEDVRPSRCKICNLLLD